MRNIIYMIVGFGSIFAGYSESSLFWIPALALVSFFGVFTNPAATNAQQQRIDSGRINEATKIFMSTYIYAFVATSFYYSVGFLIEKIF